VYLKGEVDKGMLLSKLEWTIKKEYKF
jgi:hypothetical protein